MVVSEEGLRRWLKQSGSRMSSPAQVQQMYDGIESAPAMAHARFAAISLARCPLSDGARLEQHVAGLEGIVRTGQARGLWVPDPRLPSMKPATCWCLWRNGGGECSFYTSELVWLLPG